MVQTAKAGSPVPDSGVRQSASDGGLFATSLPQPQRVARSVPPPAPSRRHGGALPPPPPSRAPAPPSLSTVSYVSVATQQGSLPSAPPIASLGTPTPPAPPPASSGRPPAPSQLDWSGYQEPKTDQPEGPPVTLKEVDKDPRTQAVRGMLSSHAKDICTKELAKSKKDLHAEGDKALAAARTATQQANTLIAQIKPSLERLKTIEGMAPLLEQANTTLQHSITQIDAASSVLLERINHAERLSKSLGDMEAARKKEYEQTAREIEVAQQVLKGLQKQQAVVRPNNEGLGGVWIVIGLIIVLFCGGFTWAVTLGPLHGLFSAKPQQAPISRIETPVASASAQPVPSSTAPAAPRLPAALMSTSLPAETPKATAKKLAPHLQPPKFDDPDVGVLEAPPEPKKRHIDKCINAIRTGVKGSGVNGDLAPFTRTVKGSTYTCQEKRDPDPDTAMMQLCNCDVS